MRYIVIIEGKLGGYLASAGPTRDGLFDNRFNSKINNQLTLRYRAMRCLHRLPATHYLTELPSHTAPSPYKEDKARRCKKGRTIRLLEEHIEDFRDRFYLVALTTDTGNLFRDTIGPNHQLVPPILRSRGRQGRRVPEPREPQLERMQRRPRGGRREFLRVVVHTLPCRACRG